ncbi:MAG: arylsulfatase [Phycisphaerales bacterium]|jgi:arylsulfatase A-like enzyme|nr:arylsulfatase [Phycisphaerales bacterium]
MGQLNQTRRNFLKMIGLGAAAMAVPRISGGAASLKGKPNVILVITDDQGYGDLGCHGNKVIKTPNLDKLYTQSTRLTNYHVGPTCAPTRAALMTGRYCNRTGVWHTIMGRSIMRRDEVTMADVFHRGGYKTSFCGKWHLGDNYPFRPRYRGFDEVLSHGGGGVGQTPDYWGNDYFDDTYIHNGKPVKFKGYCTDIWFDAAMKFAESCAKAGKPFFTYLSTNAPHSPFNVAKKYSDMYAGKPDVPNAAFYGMITNIDDNMGKLVKKLDELGIADNTILIFTTDNGTAAGYKVPRRKPKDKGRAKPKTSAKIVGFNAGMRGTKGSEYDGGHRVPFFIRWPSGRIEAKKDIGRLTAHIDVMPTLTQLCGIDNPKGVALDGASIVPLLRGGGDNWPDRTLVTDSQRLEDCVKWRKSAVMTDKWRLINGKELYDMTADGGQKNDLAASNPKIVKQLTAAYEKWWTSVSERFGEFVPIVIGSDKENPTCLTGHDWHGNGAAKVWNHRQIKGGPIVNGFWAVDVEQDGTYEFTLRRWPKEQDSPISEKFLKVTKAKIQIGKIEMAQDLAVGAKETTFKMKLKAGPAKLQTWFSDAKGKSAGAYFLYAKRL